MATKSRRYKCMVCGTRIPAPFKFKHGEICVCHRSSCMDSVSFKVQDTISIGAFSIQDLDDNELVCREAIEAFKDNESMVRGLTETVTEAFWDEDIVCDTYQDAMRVASASLEEGYIHSLKDADLPLVSYDSLKTKEARELLEKRLKGY